MTLKINDFKKQKIIDCIANHAAFDGWGDTALRTAAQECDISWNEAQFLFPNRPIDMISAHSYYGDTLMCEAVQAMENFTTLRVHEKVEISILLRFELFQDKREAIRRASSILALPQYTGKSACLLARTCDQIWLLAGDTAQDYNRYSKRLLLAGVYVSSFMYWLSDESESLNNTRRFVRTRLKNVLHVFGSLGKLRSRIYKRFT